MAVSITIQMQNNNNLKSLGIALTILEVVDNSKTFRAYIFATIHRFSIWAIPDNKSTPLLRRILLKKSSNEVGYVLPKTN